MRIKNGSSVIWYDSADESLHGDLGELGAKLRPRFPEAYYAEIDEALSVARGDIHVSRFPTLRTVTESMEVIKQVAEKRRNGV
jgi:hypothetical protein